MIPTQETIKYFFIPEGQSCSRIDFNFIYSSSADINIYVNNDALVIGYLITQQHIIFNPELVGISKGSNVKIILNTIIKKDSDLTSNIVNSDELNTLLDNSTLQLLSVGKVSNNSITVINNTTVPVLQNNYVWVGNGTPNANSNYFNTMTLDQFIAIIAPKTTISFLNNVMLQNVYSSGIMRYNINTTVLLPISPIEGTFFYISQETPIITINTIGVIKALGIYIIMFSGGSWKLIGVDKFFHKYIAITKSIATTVGTNTLIPFSVTERIDQFALIPANTYDAGITGLITIDYCFWAFTVNTGFTVTINAAFNNNNQQNIHTLTANKTNNVSGTFTSVSQSVSLTSSYSSTISLSNPTIKYSCNLSNPLDHP